jgi:hypothetical protein
VRAAVYSILNIYMIKMAGVSTSTVAIYTGFAPRWLAVLGYVLSLLLLFGSYYIRWTSSFSPCGCFWSAFAFWWRIFAGRQRSEKIAAEPAAIAL